MPASIPTSRCRRCGASIVSEEGSGIVCPRCKCPDWDSGSFGSNGKVFSGFFECGYCGMTFRYTKTFATETDPEKIEVEVLSE